MSRPPIDGGAFGVRGLAAVLSASIRLEAASTPEAVRAVAREQAAAGAPGRPVVRLVRRRLARLGAQPAAPEEEDHARDRH